MVIEVDENVQQEHVLSHESMAHVELFGRSGRDEKASRRRSENRWKLIGALVAIVLVEGVQLQMDCEADEKCTYILLYAVQRLSGNIIECLWQVCSTYVDALLWLVSIFGRG